MHACSAGTARPTIADILRDHTGSLVLGDAQRRVVSHIIACRTTALGGHLGVCDSCGHLRYQYHSCRDRHCPRCGTLDQALWAEAERQHLLPVPYFHVVFTVPPCLRPLFGGRGRAPALDALFAAVSETLLEVGAERVHAQLGALLVLHTWTQRLDVHPHLHCLVPGGGVAQGRWVPTPASYLLPSRVLAVVMQGKLLQRLERLADAGVFDRARHPVRHLLESASYQPWVVDVRQPLAGPAQVIAYFARYVRRIAISNARIVAYDGETVTFTWRDRAAGNVVKRRTLPGAVFARKFLNHVLPPRFVRIRRIGFLSNRVRRRNVGRCRQLITGETAPPPSARPPETRAAACLRVFGRDVSACPACGVGRIVERLAWRADPVALLLARVSSRSRAP